LPQAGVRSIEHANFVTEDTVAMMADYHAFYVPTFISLVQRVESAAETHPAGIHRREPAAHDRTRQEVYDWARKHKVPVGFGTDLWGPRRAKVPAAGIRDAPRPRSSGRHPALATATNAELLMEKGTLGIIAEGAYADLLIVEGNPLADLGVLMNPQKNLKFIMKDGAVYKNELAATS
jgi:imidazolonepropionase-like amidohydrolase